MTTAVVVLVVVVLAAIMFGQLRASGVARQAQQTLRTGDVEPLTEHISTLPADVQPDAWNQAVQLVWNSYERPVALRVTRAMACAVAGASIAQYWLRQALEIEPELAREVFDDDFLTTYYQPEVARACGKFG